MLARDLKKRECYSDLQRLIYLTNAAHVICFYDLCDRFEYTGLIYPVIREYSCQLCDEITVVPSRSGIFSTVIIKKSKY